MGSFSAGVAARGSRERDLRGAMDSEWEMKRSAISPMNAGRNSCPAKLKKLRPRVVIGDEIIAFAANADRVRPFDLAARSKIE
jgi:hypothetical protein